MECLFPDIDVCLPGIWRVAAARAGGGGRSFLPSRGGRATMASDGGRSEIACGVRGGLVYALYGLTDDEIQIVEEATR